MASKDDDDLFGGDDEFGDFGDFDGDFSDGDDFSLDDEKDRKTDNTPLGQARRYAGKAAAGAIGGVKNKLRDEFRETAGVFDSVESGIDEALMIKDKVTEDLKPVLNQSKILGRRLLKYGEDFVPSGLYKKLMDKLETESEDAPQKSAEQQKREMRDQQLNDSLTQIFKAQMTERLDTRRDEKAESFINRRISHAQHQESMQSMAGMEHSLQVLASFARGTQTAYMKKDLELKIRSLYFQEDTLIAIQNQNDLLNQKLEQIRHNTALPDADKINLKERIKKQAYDTVLGGLGGVLSNYGAKVSSKLMENVIGPVKDMVGSLPDAASMFLDGLEMSGSSKLTKKTLLGWGAHWLGGKIAGTVTGKLLNKVPKEVKTIIENTMRQGGITAALMLDELREGKVPVQLRGLPDYLIKPAQKIAETLAPEIDKTAGRIENKAYSRPNDPAAITNKFISTVEDVIPGYLRMQLKALEAIAIGVKAPMDQVEEKHFDVKSREFISTSTAKQRIFTEAFGTEKDRAYRVKQNIGAFTQSEGMKNLIEDMNETDQAEFKNTFANAASDLSMVIENLANSKSNNLSHFSITEINWMRQAIDPDGTIHPERITNQDDRDRAVAWFDNAFRTGKKPWREDEKGDGPKRIARVVKLMNQMFEKTIGQDEGMQEAWLTMVTQDVSERVKTVMKDNDRYARTMDRLSNTYGWGSTVTNEFYQRGEDGQAVYKDGLMVLDSNKYLDTLNGRVDGAGDGFHVLNSDIGLEDPSKLFEKSYFDRDEKERDLYYQIRNEHPDWEDGKIWAEVKKQKKSEKFQKAAIGATNGIVRGLKQGLGGAMDYARKNFEFVDKAYQNIYAPAAEAIKGAGTFIKDQAGKLTDFVVDKAKASSSWAVDAAYNFLTKESSDTKHVSFTHLAKILFVTEKDSDGVIHAKFRKECPIELALDIVAHQSKVLNALRTIRKAIKENGNTMPVCKVLDLFMPLNLRKISEIDDVTVAAIQNAETEDAKIALLRQYLNEYKVGARPVPPPSEAIVENVESPETSKLHQLQTETAGTPEDAAAVAAATQAEAQTLNDIASGKQTTPGTDGTDSAAKKLDEAVKQNQPQSKAQQTVPPKSAAAAEVAGEPDGTDSAAKKLDEAVKQNQPQSKAQKAQSQSGTASGKQTTPGAASLDGMTKTQRKKAARQARQQAKAQKAEPLKTAAEQSKEAAVEKDIEQKYNDAIQAFKDFVESLKELKQGETSKIKALQLVMGEGRKVILALYDFIKDSKTRKFLEEKHLSDLALLDEIYQCFIKQGDFALLQLDDLSALEDEGHSITPALRSSVQAYQEWCISIGLADIQEKYKGMTVTEIAKEIGGNLKDSALKKLDTFKNSETVQKVSGFGKGIVGKVKELGSKAVEGAGKLFNAGMERLATRDHTQILRDQLEVQQRILETIAHIQVVGTAPSQLGKVKNGAKTVVGKLWQGVKSTAVGMGNAALGLATLGLKTAGGALTAARHAVSNRVCNVYVAPQNPDQDIDIQNPVIPAQEFTRGNVFKDPKATKPIVSVADIKGVVYNSQGIPWFSKADYKRGLVDEERKPINPLAARTGRLIYKSGRWAINTTLALGEKVFNQAVLKTAGKLMVKAMTAPMRLVSATVHTFIDVFRADDMSKPLITKADQEKKRVVFENGDEVKSTASIDGPLIWVGRTAESKGSKYAITQEDFEAGLVDQFGEPISAFTRRIGNLLGKGIGFGMKLGGHFLSGGWNVVTGSVKLATKIVKAVFKGKYPYISVYVRDATTGDFDPNFPRLVGAKIKEGAYFYEDNEKVTSAYGIKGPVYTMVDGKPEIVIAADEIERACDVNGKSVTAMAGRSLAMKALSLAGGAVSWGITKAFKAAKAVVKGVGKAAGWLTGGIFNSAKDTVGLIYGGLKDILGTVFHGEGVLGRKDLQEVVGDKLEDIYILLHDSLSPKKVLGDSDGDGDRDGSYQDYKQKQKEREARYKEKQKEAEERKAAAAKAKAEKAEQKAAERRHEEMMSSGGGGGHDWLMDAFLAKDLMGGVKNSKWGRRFAGIGKLFGKAKNSTVGKGMTEGAGRTLSKVFGAGGLVGKASAGTGRALSKVFGAQGLAGKATAGALNKFGGTGGKQMAHTLSHVGWGATGRQATAGALDKMKLGKASAAVSKVGVGGASKAGLGMLASKLGTGLAMAARGFGGVTTYAMLAIGAFALSKWAGKKIWYMFADTPSEKEWTKLRLRQYGLTEKNEGDIEDLEEDMQEVFDRERGPLTDDDLEEYAEDLGFLDFKAISASAAKLDAAKQEKMKKRQAYMSSKMKAKAKDAEEGGNGDAPAPAAPKFTDKELDELLPDTKDLRMQYFSAWMQERFSPVFSSYFKIVRYYGHGSPGDDIDPSDIDDELQTTAQKQFMQQTSPIVEQTKDIVPTKEAYLAWRSKNAEKLIAAKKAKESAGGAAAGAASGGMSGSFAAKSTEDKLKAVWTGYREGYNKLKDKAYEHWYTAPLGWTLSLGDFLVNDTLEFIGESELGQFVGKRLQQTCKRGIIGGLWDAMFGRNDREQQWFEARCANYGFTSTGVDMSGDMEDAIEDLEKKQFAVNVGESPEVSDDEIWDFGQEIGFLEKSLGKKLWSNVKSAVTLNFYGDSTRELSKMWKKGASNAKKGLDTEQRRKDYLITWYTTRFAPVYEIYMKIVVAAAGMELGSEPDPNAIDEYKNEEVLAIFNKECQGALSSILKELPDLAPTEEAYQAYLEQITNAQNTDATSGVESARQQALADNGGNIATNLSDEEKELAEMEASGKTDSLEYRRKKWALDRQNAFTSENINLLGDFSGMTPEEIKAKLGNLLGKEVSGERLKWVGARIESYGWKKSDFKPELLKLITELENDHKKHVFESISPDQWEDSDIQDVGAKLGICKSSGNWFTGLFSSKKKLSDEDQKDADNRTTYVKNWLIGKFYPVYKAYYDVMGYYGAVTEAGWFSSGEIDPTKIELAKREEAYQTFLTAVKAIVNDPELKKYIPTPEGYEAFVKGETVADSEETATTTNLPSTADLAKTITANDSSDDQKQPEGEAGEEGKEGTPDEQLADLGTLSEEAATAEETPTNSAALNKALEFIKDYNGVSLMSNAFDFVTGFFSGKKHDDKFLDARGIHYGFTKPLEDADIIEEAEEAVLANVLDNNPAFEDGDAEAMGKILGLIDENHWLLSGLENSNPVLATFSLAKNLKNKLTGEDAAKKAEQAERIEYIKAWYNSRFYPIFRAYVLILDGYGAVQHNLIRADKLMPEELSDTDREAAIADFEKAVAALNLSGEILKLIPTVEGYLAFRKEKEDAKAAAEENTDATDTSGLAKLDKDIEEQAEEEEKSLLDKLSGTVRLAMENRVDQALDNAKTVGSFLSGIGDKMMNSLKDYFTPSGDDRPDDGTAKTEEKGVFNTVKDAILHPGRTLLEVGRSAFNSGDNTKFTQDLSGLSGAKIPDGGAGDLGSYVKRFESGSRGPSAIGYDSTGGTSYGSYQIATKTGTMKNFLAYAKKNGGEFGAKLADALGVAGDLNTGSKNGAGPQVWKQFAGVDGGEALHKLEKGFIKATHFDIALKKLSPEARALVERDRGLKESLWSTAVQHGPGGAAKIFNSTFKPGITPEDWLKAIYASRANKFGSSTAAVRKSVQNRFKEELPIMLGLAGVPAESEVDDTNKSEIAGSSSGSTQMEGSSAAQMSQQANATASGNGASGGPDVPTGQVENTPVTGAGPADPNAIENILDIARHNAQGADYSQANRFAPKKYDCSSFVARTLTQAGFNVPPTNTTATLGPTLLKAGFEKLPGPVGDASQLQPGDIMLRPATLGNGHTEIYTGNGNSIGAHSSGSGVNERKHWNGYDYTEAYRLTALAGGGTAANDENVGSVQGTGSSIGERQAELAAKAADTAADNAQTTVETQVNNAANQAVQNAKDEAQAKNDQLLADNQKLSPQVGGEGGAPGSSGNPAVVTSTPNQTGELSSDALKNEAQLAELRLLNQVVSEIKDLIAQQINGKKDEPTGGTAPQAAPATPVGADIAKVFEQYLGVKSPVLQALMKMGELQATTAKTTASVVAPQTGGGGGSPTFNSGISVKRHSA